MDELRKEVWDRLSSADPWTSWDAAEELRGKIQERHLPHLIAAYHTQPRWPIRAEILDLIGLVRSDPAKQFLLEICRSRAFYLLRYYAIRNLIELGVTEWRPNRKSERPSDFNDSLAAYEAYSQGSMSRHELWTLAISRSKWTGDHWYWLTDLAKPSATPEPPLADGSEVGTGVEG